MRTGWRNHVWQSAALFLAAVLTCGAAVLLYHHRGYVTPAAAGVIPTDGSIAATAAAGAGAGASTKRPATKAPVSAHPGNPLRVVMSEIGLDAPVVPVAIRNNTLDIPEDVHTLGWWDGGAKPGSSQGTAVIVGHVDSAVMGRGALFLLSRVDEGDLITVTTNTGTNSYEVKAIRPYLKNELPKDIFSSKGISRLVLITCGGPFNSKTHHYRNNVVVYGIPV